MVQTTSLQLEMLKKIVHIRTNEQKKKSPCSLFTEPIVEVRKIQIKKCLENGTIEILNFLFLKKGGSMRERMSLMVAQMKRSSLRSICKKANPPKT